MARALLFCSLACALIISSGCDSSPTAPAANPLDWDIIVLGTMMNDPPPEGPPPDRCDNYDHWAPPGVWGPSKNIGKTFPYSGYSITAYPVAQGQAVTGEVTYYGSAGWTSSLFGSKFQWVSGNGYGGWVSVRFISVPLGSAVNGMLCGPLMDAE